MGWCLSRSERQQQIVFIERKGVSRKEGAYTHGIICCKKPFEKQLRSWVEETSVKHAARPPLVLQGRGGNRRGYTSSVGHRILSEWQGNVVGTLKKIQHLVSLGGKIFCPPCERNWVSFCTFQEEDKSMFIDQSKSKNVIFEKKLHFSRDMLAILLIRIKTFWLLFLGLLLLLVTLNVKVLRDSKLPPVKNNSYVVLRSVKADMMCNSKEG